jgi:hypothetical protein
MAAASIETGFTVWGIDKTPYGPVELPTLISWIKDERVMADTWVFDARNCSWSKASEIIELQMFFRRKKADGATGETAASPRGIEPGALRRIKILAELSDDQLERFANFVEVEKIPQWSVVVRQGEPGDTMYFILQGELRVRMDVMGKETILATLGPGDFFGDISLFDHGPRSADVIANVDSLVVKISAGAVNTLEKEAPDLATTFLRAIGKTLTHRIRADNKRFGDFMKFKQAAE